MDYNKLAEQLVNMRARMPQVKPERAMSEMAHGEILALNYLAVNENKAYPKDISKALMLTTARIAAMLKSLEKQGLIIRTPDPSDNRQVIVELTEIGISTVKARRNAIIKTVAKMLESLGPEDAEAYVRIQKKLIETGDIWR